MFTTYRFGTKVLSMNNVVFGSLWLDLDKLVRPECHTDRVSCSFSPLQQRVRCCKTTVN